MHMLVRLIRRHLAMSEARPTKAAQTTLAEAEKLLLARIHAAASND